MGHKQPSMVLGPASPQDSAAELPGASSRAQTVELSAVDSKGRAVPGAFGRAATGASAPDGGRKPKRVSCSCCQLPGALLYMTILPGRFRLQLATDKLGTSHPQRQLIALNDTLHHHDQRGMSKAFDYSDCQDFHGT